MSESSKPIDELYIQLQSSSHSMALKAFTKYTIQNPDFFKLSPEEQKKKAMEFVEKYKASEEKSDGKTLE